MTTDVTTTVSDLDAARATLAEHKARRLDAERRAKAAGELEAAAHLDDLPKDSAAHGKTRMKAEAEAGQAARAVDVASRRLRSAERASSGDELTSRNAVISARLVQHEEAVLAVAAALTALIAGIEAQLDARQAISSVRGEVGIQSIDPKTEILHRLARFISGRLVAVPDLAHRIQDMTGHGDVDPPWAAREIAMSKNLLIPTTAETSNG